MLNTAWVNALIIANSNKGESIKKSIWNERATECEIISLRFILTWNNYCYLIWSTIKMDLKSILIFVAFDCWKWSKGMCQNVSCQQKNFDNIKMYHENFRTLIFILNNIKMVLCQQRRLQSVGRILLPYKLFFFMHYLLSGKRPM